MLLRLVWFTLASTVISYGVFLFLGSTMHARASGSYEPVLVRDVLGPGSHHLSGMIMVPTPCHQLSLHTEVISTTSYMLSFKTWREPSVDCVDDKMPRPFSAILFAPAVGVRFGAELDGVGQPIVVMPVVDLVQPLR